MSRSEFFHFLVFLEVDARQRIMLDFFDLLAYDVLGDEFVRDSHKRSLEAAWWVFQLEDISRFDEGYASLLRAADATAHLLYAYLRNYHDPKHVFSDAAELVRMYVEPHYPPKMPSWLQERAYKVVLEVRELASTPWELLERAGRTDGVPASLRELIGFSSTTRLTPECLKVLDAIERHVQKWDSRDASEDYEQGPVFWEQTHLSAARVVNVTQMKLHRYFWGAWVQSNSPEETPERSLMFGQSIVVRTQQRDLVFGGTVTANDSSDVPEWVVFEEVKAVKKVKDMEAEEGNTFKKYCCIR